MVKRIFYYLSLSSVLFVIIYTQVLQAGFDIIDHDDIDVLFRFTDNFFYNCFINAYHGRFITNTVATLIGAVLPLHFDVHPVYWIQTFGAGIKAIFIFIICYLLSSSLFIFDKNNNKYKNFIIFIFTLFFYFLYQKAFRNSYESMLYMSFYGFVFPFIIYFFFWKGFIKYFCGDDNKIINWNYKKILFFCVVPFLLGCSSEFFSFSSFCTLTLLMIVLIINKYKNINIYICYISLYIGFFIYILNPGFWLTVQEKTIPFFGSLDTFKAWFAEVINILHRTFFSDFIYIVIIIIILFLFLLFLKIENKKRKILIVSLYLTGVLFFYLSMAFARITFGNTELYLCHFDIIVQIQTALIFLIMVQISFLSDYKYLKNILIVILFCCLLYSTKENLIDACGLIIKNDRNSYISKYYNYKPENILNRYRNEYILLENIKNSRQIYSFEKNFRLRPCDGYSYNYMRKIYNLKYVINKKNTDIAFADELYETFLNEGGIPLSQEELDKHDFNSLLKKYKKK